MSTLASARCLDRTCDWSSERAGLALLGGEAQSHADDVVIHCTCHDTCGGAPCGACPVHDAVPCRQCGRPSDPDDQFCSVSCEERYAEDQLPAPPFVEPITIASPFTPSTEEDSTCPF